MGGGQASEVGNRLTRCGKEERLALVDITSKELLPLSLVLQSWVAHWHGHDVHRCP